MPEAEAATAAPPTSTDAELAKETTEAEPVKANGDAETTVESIESKEEGKSHKSSKDERDWRERRAEDQRGDRDGRNKSRSQYSRGGRGYDGRISQAQREKYKGNIKTDFANIPESSDPDEIRKQVEFYFSDSNIFTDKFLLSQVQGSKNVAVPIKTIHNFKRMRHFQPYSTVVSALRDSKTLEVVDGSSANEEAVKRKIPVPEALNLEDPRGNKDLYEKAALRRSVYVKGFGQEGPSTQFDIEAFFAPYGPTNAIRLRRVEAEKTFKGSVFAEFETEEGAQAFLTLENKPKWGAGEAAQELLVMSKEDYIKTKAEKVGQGRTYGNQRDARGGRGGRGRRGGGRHNQQNGRGRDREGDNKNRRKADEDEEEGEEDGDDKADADAGADGGDAEAGADAGEETAAASKKRPHDDDSGAADQAGGTGDAKRARTDDVAAS